MRSVKGWLVGFLCALAVAATAQEGPVHNIGCSLGGCTYSAAVYWGTSSTPGLGTTGVSGASIGPGGSIVIFKSGIPQFTAYRTDTGLSTNSNVGFFTFFAPNSSNSYVSFGRILAQGNTFTAGAEAGSLQFQAAVNGTLTTQLTVNAQGVVFPKYSGAPTTAPAASKLQIFVVAGTIAGSCKIQAIAGTSTTPVTVVDNVGTGC